MVPPVFADQPNELVLPGPEAPVGSSTGTAASAAVAVPADGAGFAAAADEPELDANRLQVYRVALELHLQCSALVATLNRIVKDQLERASLSVVLNVAEAVDGGPGGTRLATTQSRVAAPPKLQRFWTC